MKEEIPKCNSCGQPMFEISELAGTIQVGEFVDTPTHSLDGKLTGNVKVWKQTGIRSPKLYQCPECKDVKVL